MKQFIKQIYIAFIPQYLHKYKINVYSFAPVFEYGLNLNYQSVFVIITFILHLFLKKLIKN